MLIKNVETRFTVSFYIENSIKILSSYLFCNSKNSIVELICE